MTEILKFDNLHDAVSYLEVYFKENPPMVFDTDAKIYFQHNFYYLILNKWGWDNEV